METSTIGSVTIKSYDDYYNRAVGGDDEAKDDEYYYNDDYVEADFDSISQIGDAAVKISLKNDDTVSTIIEIDADEREARESLSLPEPIYLFSLVLTIFGLIQIILGGRNTTNGSSPAIYKGTGNFTAVQRNSGGAEQRLLNNNSVTVLAVKAPVRIVMLKPSTARIVGVSRRNSLLTPIDEEPLT